MKVSRAGTLLLAAVLAAGTATAAPRTVTDPQAPVRFRPMAR